MPLIHVDRPGLESPTGVHFPMMDGYRSVRVHVTVDALLGKDRLSAGVTYLDRFQASRKLYEFLAMAKYKPDQPIPKVTITFEDVLAASQRMKVRLGRFPQWSMDAPPRRDSRREEGTGTLG
jgi:hypothetical protein